MSDSSIECGKHGQAEATFVCRHLIDDPLQRWCCDYPSEDDPWPDAWCLKCDEILEAEAEREESDDEDQDPIPVKLLCHHCYQEFKGSSVAPQMARQSASWDPLVSVCVSELQQKQDRLKEQFDLSVHERWDWDQDTAQIVFSSQGVPAVVAGIQFVGSVSTVSGTWLWSWANPSFASNVSHRLLEVRDYGETHDLAKFTVSKWPAEEVDGWEMTAVAARILGAEGAYRTPGDTGHSFMLLFDVRCAE